MGQDKTQSTRADAPKKNELPASLASVGKPTQSAQPLESVTPHDQLGDETEFVKRGQRITRPARWSPCDDF